MTKPFNARSYSASSVRLTNWAASAPSVTRELLGEPSSATRHELRYGRRGSLSVDLRNGTWYDFEEGTGGGILDLVCSERRCSPKEALTWLRERGLLDDSSQPPAAPDRPKPPAPPQADPARTRLAHELWAAARPVTGGPGRAYLAQRSAWPPPDLPGAPDLPDTVRWLDRHAQPERDEAAKWYAMPPESAGALVFAWRTRAGDLTAVSLIAVSAAGERITWFGERAVRIRTVGSRTGATLVTRTAGEGGPGPVHVAEGEIDALALAIASTTGPGQVEGAGGTSGIRHYEPAHGPQSTGPVSLYCDPDRGGRSAVLDASERLRTAGYRPRIVWSALDPADELAERLAEDIATLTERGLAEPDATRTAWLHLLKAAP